MSSAAKVVQNKFAMVHAAASAMVPAIDCESSGLSRRFFFVTETSFSYAAEFTTFFPVFTSSAVGDATCEPNAVIP